MHKKKLTIIIDRPINTVFEFTTNPQNTSLWVPFVDEEIAREFPPKIGTPYKSRRGNNWNISKITKYKPNKIFKLENDIFSVEYIYDQINPQRTKLTYIETVKRGKLTDSFNIEVLQKLKIILEST